MCSREKNTKDTREESKAKKHARQSVWWPGFSSQLSGLVMNCRVCSKERTNVREPFMPTKPTLAETFVGADLFTLSGTNYLLVMDYFSRYVVIDQLSSTQLSPSRSTDVIVYLKSMFARHGIAETLVTNNW